MHSEAMALFFVGLLLVMGSSVYSIRHPRREGEPFGTQRKMMLALCLVGGLCMVPFVVAAFTDLAKGQI
jgi:TRAP-type C4-dicarboxylate transport system permease small subunit